MKAKETKTKKTAQAHANMHSSIKIVVIFFIIGIFVGGFISLFYNQNKGLKQDAMELVEEQQKLSRPVDQKVSDVVRIEGQGKPVVAVVKNVSDLSNLPLYRFAKNGDRVVVYENVTIIYDEEQNKIVSVVPQDLLGGEPITATGDEATNEGSDSAETTEDTKENTTPALPPEKITVEVRNGGSIKGFAGKTATAIKTEFKYSTVAANASNNYTKATLVNLGGADYDAAIKNLQEKYSVAEVLTALPTGEKTSDAPIVLIVVE